MSDFSERLRVAMQAKEFRQVDVIRLAEQIGAPMGIRIGKSHMSQYVSGKNIPRMDIIQILAKVLDVEPMWLLGQGSEKISSKPVRKADGRSGTMREFSKSSKLANVLYDVRGPVLDAAKQMEEQGMHILKLNIGNPAPFGFKSPEEVIFDMKQ